KQFNIVDSNEMREIELMTNLEDLFIEDTNAVLSRSDFDTRMNIMSSEARDEDDVSMSDMNSSRRVSDQSQMKHRRLFNQSDLIIIDQNSDESSVRAISKRTSARIASLVDRNTIVNCQVPPLELPKLRHRRYLVP